MFPNFSLTSGWVAKYRSNPSFASLTRRAAVTPLIAAGSSLPVSARISLMTSPAMMTAST